MSLKESFIAFSQTKFKHSIIQKHQYWIIRTYHMHFNNSEIAFGRKIAMHLSYSEIAFWRKIARSGAIRAIVYGRHNEALHRRFIKFNTRRIIPTRRDIML